MLEFFASAALRSYARRHDLDWMSFDPNMGATSKVFDYGQWVVAPQSVGYWALYLAIEDEMELISFNFKSIEAAKERAEELHKEKVDELH